ncbi:MAG TPA: sigma-54 dependent transcriptional regulator [Sandaracinaceae bacterium LLY-WYZ-13_1]|nr:sigma-54 dependent transcriptional regulator [Sandaracinaceae bacterium LLY-WYZ-13_1]
MASGGSSILLICGPDEPIGRGVESRLRERGYETFRAPGVGAGAEAFRAAMPDVVVVTPPLPDEPVSEVLAGLRRLDGSIPIVVAGDAQHVRPEQLMFEGAFECVTDPLQSPHRLLGAVGYALGAREEDRELSYLRDREASGARMLGEDPSMRRVFERVRQLCTRTAGGRTPTILVLGETGTGKGALAKAIHFQSVRRNRPFVQVNCAALPPNLVESELFGYERGAFTDAGRGRPGLFETADGGTLFLDEIASVPLELQAKLLTSIEDRQVRRLGGRKAISIDVQLIAAAQPVLRTMVKRGAFREDLFHRLNVLSIQLPPLRERGDDAILLAREFVADLCSEYGVPPLELGESAAAFIRRYHWPGNVRELRNQIERIVLLSESDQIEGWQFERASGEFLRVEPEADLEREDDASGLQIRLPSHGISLTELEKEVIRRALELNEGNVSRTARYLSITRQTLIYRMKKFGIQR